MMLEVLLLALLGLAPQAPQAPVPRPFPQPNGGQSSQPAPARPAQPAGQSQQPPQAPPASQAPPPAQPTPQPAPAAAPPTVSSNAALPAPPNTIAPSEEMLGVKVHPSGQFIGSYDAGRGQRFYLWGSSASFIELVTYYRTLLRQRGELVFDAPATHEFDIGRFREETMAFPPGVTIKEYKSEISDGYPNPKPGGQPARFPTIIQIVPVPTTER